MEPDSGYAVPGTLVSKQYFLAPFGTRAFTLATSAAIVFASHLCGVLLGQWVTDELDLVHNDIARGVWHAVRYGVSAAVPLPNRKALGARKGLG